MAGGFVLIILALFMSVVVTINMLTAGRDGVGFGTILLAILTVAAYIWGGILLWQNGFSMWIR